MKKNLLSSILAISAVQLTAFGAPVDLSSWSVENFSPNAGNWQVDGSGTSVRQISNGNPTVFLSDTSAMGTDIQGKIRVETFSDDDYIGFVLGFNSGDFSNALADYLLIDWKQGNQDVADAGLAVSRVTGVIPSASGFWGHTDGVTELARGTTLGSTGWTENTDYEFQFLFTPTALQVFVDGVQQIDITGSFSGGNLGFYNYSQAYVRYSGFSQDVLPDPVNVPEAGSTLVLLGIAGLAFGFLPRRK